MKSCLSFALLTALMLSAQAQAQTKPTYTVSVADPAISEELKYERWRHWRADFDGDKQEDGMAAAGDRFLEIKYKSGKAFRYDVESPDTIITSSERIFPAGVNKPASMIVSQTKVDQKFRRTSQALFLHGQDPVTGELGLKLKKLPNLKMSARDVACTQLSFMGDKTVCMFASYYVSDDDNKNYTTLAEIDANGNAVDVTEGKGLPFRGQQGMKVGNDQKTNGKFMMGFAWVDLNNDGLPDLMGVGQHSEIFYAFMQRTAGGYSFTGAQWMGPRDEYLGISALDMPGVNLPCAYIHMESAEADHHKNDYILCYDAASRTWSEPALPAVDGQGKVLGLYAGTERCRFVEKNGAVYIMTQSRVPSMKNGKQETENGMPKWIYSHPMLKIVRTEVQPPKPNPVTAGSTGGGTVGRTDGSNGGSTVGGSTASGSTAGSTAGSTGGLNGNTVGGSTGSDCRPGPRGVRCLNGGANGGASAGGTPGCRPGMRGCVQQ